MRGYSYAKNVLHKLQQENNYRQLHNLRHNGLFVIKDDKTLLNLCSNDYLNIANDTELKTAFLQSIDIHNIALGAKSSRILGANHEIYTELESRLNTMFGKHSLLFNSGYHANISCMQALATLGRVLFVLDKYVHASVIDGVLLSKAGMKRFLHNDMQDLESILKKYHRDYDLVVIVTEGLFSMDGDFAKLDSMVEMKKAYGNMMLYVDEAHSIGIIGESGLGLARFYNCLQDIDFLVLTFGKAVSSVGAAIVTSDIYRDFFINKARGFIYSTALPPVNVAFSNFVFSRLDTMQDRRDRLESISRFFRQELSDMGLYVLGEYNIVSLVIGDNARTLEFSRMLENSGFFAPAIRHPSVPLNLSRIRFSLNSGLCKQDLYPLIACIKDTNVML